MAITDKTVVVPHRGGEPWGLHFIAASECEDFAELVMGTRFSEQDNLWIGSPEQENGHIQITDTPGFGVKPNKNLL